MSLQFRPRSPTEIVDAAVQLGRRHYQPLVALSAVIAIPNVLIGLGTQWLVPPAVQASGQLAGAADIAFLLGATLLSAIWLIIGFGALVASTASAYVEGRALEPMAAMRAAMRRAAPLVVANLLAYLLVVLVVALGLVAFSILAGLAVAVFAVGRGGDTTSTALVMLSAVLGTALVGGVVLAALVVWSRYANVTAAVVLEERGIAGAIRRSGQLARGNLWRSTGVVLIMFVLYLVGFFTSWAIFALLIRDANISANVAGVLVLALYPFLGAMLTLLYYDLRIRHEGYDLELMARALDAAEGAPAGTPPAAGTSP